MNYKNIHDNIINKAKSENRKKLNKDDENFIYYEKHHILPKCLGGLDNKNNLILLTAKEHFLIHKILNILHPDSRGLFYGYRTMSLLKKQNRDYKIGAREYERIKIIFNFYNSGENHPNSKKKGINHPSFGKKLSSETKQKISQARKGKYKGENSPWWGVKKSEEHIKKLSESRKGRKASEETKLKMRKSHQNVSIEVREKISKANKGKPSKLKGKKLSEDHILKIVASLIGKKHTDETKKKRSDSLLGKRKSKEHKDNLIKSWINREYLICPYCNLKSRNRGNMNRYHFDNCKFKKL